MEPTILIIAIILIISLILVRIYFTKIFKTPSSKLNYIIIKYRLKNYSVEDLENLLYESDADVSEKDKKIIKKLLIEEYPL